MRMTSFHRSITSITNSFTRKPRVFKLIKLKRAWERNDPIKYWQYYPSPPTLFARFLFLFVCPPVQINSKKGKISLVLSYGLNSSILTPTDFTNDSLHPLICILVGRKSKTDQWSRTLLRSCTKIELLYSSRRVQMFLQRSLTLQKNKTE